MDKMKNFLKEQSNCNPFVEDPEPAKNFEGSHNEMVSEKENLKIMEKSDKKKEPSNNVPMDKQEEKEKDDQKKKEKEDLLRKTKEEERKFKLEKFAEDQKNYKSFLMEKIPQILKDIKVILEELKKTKTTRADLFNNERKDYFTIFVNPVICLKR